jgi:hypothetical protein
MRVKGEDATALHATTPAGSSVVSANLLRTVRAKLL